MQTFDLRFCFWKKDELVRQGQLSSKQWSDLKKSQMVNHKNMQENLKDINVAKILPKIFIKIVIISPSRMWCTAIVIFSSFLCSRFKCINHKHKNGGMDFHDETSVNVSIKQQISKQQKHPKSRSSFLNNHFRFFLWITQLKPVYNKLTKECQTII